MALDARAYAAEYDGHMEPHRHRVKVCAANLSMCSKDKLSLMM